MKTFIVSILALVMGCGGGTANKPPMVAPADAQPVVDDPALPFAQRLQLVRGAELDALVRSVTLTSNRPDGVRYRRATGALGPFEVHAAFADGKPVHGAALAVIDGAGAHLGDPARTDDSGVAHVNLPAGLPPRSNLRVILETPAGVTGSAVLPVSLREVTLENARVALKFDVTVGDAETSDADAVSAFASQWKQRGGGTVEALAPNLAELLASPKNTDLVIRDIAAHDGATIDVIILATVHTQFANKMGARSVWHSAHGVMQIYDAWTGDLIAEHTRDVQAVGLGDQAASAKAIVELMRALSGDAAGEVKTLTAGISSASR